jgi:hypothetical protein
VSTPTTNLGLKIPVDADNARSYLETDLGSSLTTIDNVLGPVKTTGSIIFSAASGYFSQDNANLFWDDATNRLGIGTAAPSTALHVVGTTTFSPVVGNQPWTTANMGTALSYSTFVNTGGSLFVGVDNSIGGAFGTAYAGALWHSGAFPLLFGTNNVARATIGSNGGLTLNSGSFTFSAAASKIVPGATSLSVRNNADSADNLLVNDAGGVTVRNSLVVSAGGIGVTGAAVFNNNMALTGTLNSQTISSSASFTGSATVANGLTVTAGGFVVSAGGANVTGLATFNTGVTLTGSLTMATAASKIVPGATSLSLRNNADSADNLILTDAGAATFRSTVGGITTLTATTLAGTLSTAAQGSVTSLGTLTSLTISGTLTLSAAASKIVPGATSLSLRNNADSADNLILTDAGSATIRVALTVGQRVDQDVAGVGGRVVVERTTRRRAACQQPAYAGTWLRCPVSATSDGPRAACRQHRPHLGGRRPRCGHARAGLGLPAAQAATRRRRPAPVSRGRCNAALASPPDSAGAVTRTSSPTRPRPK